jgi:hypothetical protein
MYVGGRFQFGLGRLGDREKPFRELRTEASELGHSRLGNKKAATKVNQITHDTALPRISLTTTRCIRLVEGIGHDLDFGQHGRRPCLLNSPYVAYAVVGIHSGVRRGRSASSSER